MAKIRREPILAGKWPQNMEINHFEAATEMGFEKVVNYGKNEVETKHKQLHSAHSISICVVDGTKPLNLTFYHCECAKNKTSNFMALS